MASVLDGLATTTNVHITVLSSQQLWGHFTKFKTKTQHHMHAPNLHQ